MAAFAAVLVGLLLCEEGASEVVRLSGAGASFPKEVYQLWIPAYRQFRSDHVTLEMTYESIGSGGGKARIKGESFPLVDYAGSDSLLTAADYEQYPDLKMIPVMAGAVVVAFNLPGINSLNLTLDNLVGIYNGSLTRWDDPKIQEVNPNIHLPAKTILPIARSDKSGTTDVFTGVLSAHSLAWRETYGSFSTGLPSDTSKARWNTSVVRYFGFGNRGVAGLILSFPYSVTYLSIADAKKAKITSALIQNLAGNVVSPTVSSVQGAMRDADGTFDLTNPTGNWSYPIATFTYFIIRMSTMHDRNTATELVRYITWFYTNEIARQYCTYRNMVPLDAATANGVINNVLKAVTCRGENVFDMVQDQIRREQPEEVNDWKNPIAVLGPVLSVVAAVCLGLLLRRKVNLYKQIIQHSWIIPYAEIRFGATDIDQIRISRAGFNAKSLFATHQQQSSYSNDQQGRLKIGVYADKLVALFEIQSGCGCNLMANLEKKRSVISLRDTVVNVNVLKFMGLTQSGNLYMSVCDNNTV